MVPGLPHSGSTKGFKKAENYHKNLVSIIYLLIEKCPLRIWLVSLEDFFKFGNFLRTYYKIGNPGWSGDRKLGETPQKREEIKKMVDKTIIQGANHTLPSTNHGNQLFKDLANHCIICPIIKKWFWNSNILPQPIIRNNHSRIWPNINNFANFSL